MIKAKLKPVKTVADKTVGKTAGKTMAKPILKIVPKLVSPSEPITKAPYAITHPKETAAAIEAFIGNRGKVSHRCKYGAWSGPNKKIIDDLFVKIFTDRGFDMSNPEAYSRAHAIFLVHLSIRAKNQLEGSGPNSAASRETLRKHCEKLFIDRVPNGTGIIIDRTNTQRDRFVIAARNNDSVIFRYAHVTPQNTNFTIGSKYKFAFVLENEAAARRLSLSKFKLALNLMKIDISHLPGISESSFKSNMSKRNYTNGKSESESEIELKPKIVSAVMQSTLENKYGISLKLLRQSLVKNPYAIDKEVARFTQANPEVSQTDLEAYIMKNVS